MPLAPTPLTRLSSSGLRVASSGRRTIGIHAVLIGYALIALTPVLLIVMNSFKTREAIFGRPYFPPLPGVFSPSGYLTMFERAHFARYFANSAIVAGAAMRSEEHTSELQSLAYLVCRLLLEKKKQNTRD